MRKWPDGGRWQRLRMRVWFPDSPMTTRFAGWREADGPVGSHVSEVPRRVLGDLRMNRRRPGLQCAPAHWIGAPTLHHPERGLAHNASVDAESRTKDLARSGRPQSHALWAGGGKPPTSTRPGWAWETTERGTSVLIPPMRLDPGNRVANRDDDVLPDAIRGPRLVKSGGQSRAAAR